MAEKKKTCDAFSINPLKRSFALPVIVITSSALYPAHTIARLSDKNDK